jgi:hypothetical protein
MWISLDVLGITLKDNMMGYLNRILLGYLRISWDIYLRYTFVNMYKKISWISKDTLRYFFISLCIPTYSKISQDIQWGKLPMHMQGLLHVENVSVYCLADLQIHFGNYSAAG